VGVSGEKRQTSRAVVPKDAWGCRLTGMGLYPHIPVSMGGGWRGHAAPVGCSIEVGRWGGYGGGVWRGAADIKGSDTQGRLGAQSHGHGFIPP
jgi:hypothetical protein